MTHIEIGDYIEGYELISIGTDEDNSVINIQTIRIEVASITQYMDNHFVFHGRADDKYGGTREGTIDTHLGLVKKLGESDKKLPYELNQRYITYGSYRKYTNKDFSVKEYNMSEALYDETLPVYKFEYLKEK